MGQCDALYYEQNKLEGRLVKYHWKTPTDTSIFEKEKCVLWKTINHSSSVNNCFTCVRVLQVPSGRRVSRRSRQWVRRGRDGWPFCVWHCSPVTYLCLLVNVRVLSCRRRYLEWRARPISDIFQESETNKQIRFGRFFDKAVFSMPATVLGKLVFVTYTRIV